MVGSDQKSSSSSICLIFGSVCGGWGSLGRAHAHSVTCLLPVQVSSCNASAVKTRYGAPRETLQRIEERGSSSLPPAQLSLLSWITCIISDITCFFFSSSVDLLLLTSATLIVSPSSESADVIRCTYFSLWQTEKKNPAIRKQIIPFCFIFIHMPLSHTAWSHVFDPRVTDAVMVEPTMPCRVSLPS